MDVDIINIITYKTKIYIIFKILIFQKDFTFLMFSFTAFIDFLIEQNKK